MMELSNVFDDAGTDVWADAFGLVFFQVITLPEVTGIELALNARRTHYRLRNDRFHCRLPKRRTHYSVDEETR